MTSTPRADFRFPKSARLRNAREFQLVSSRGRRGSSAFFVVLTFQTAQSAVRLGVTVSKKVGNAVQRNRVKRVIRETFRVHQGRLTPGLDCVVIAKPLAGQTVNEALSCNLRDLLARHFRRADGSDSCVISCSASSVCING
ncbi:MAG: ribonuclease P protein component [Magnetococcales bacterium]|nr:ribonuclease P protein component [Magnetococcales bacterium]NGZ06374.1 ribonuclease P protein component [Magnetococcales bacterium]